MRVGEAHRRPRTRYSETPRQCARPATRLGLFGRPAGLSLPPSPSGPKRFACDSRCLGRACPLPRTRGQEREPCLTQSKRTARP